MLMTAAGTIRPATVLVLGAGRRRAAGDRTARRLGAVVQGSTSARRSRSRSSCWARSSSSSTSAATSRASGGYAKELTPEQQARQQELMAEAIGKVDAAHSWSR